MATRAHRAPIGLALWLGFALTAHAQAPVPVTDVNRVEHLVLATSKTSTMQEELRAAGEAGFEFVGVTVASTRFGGNEVVSILRRPIERP
jgi:hypothetical protein